MSFKFNPLTGKLDLVNPTSGSGPGPSGDENFSYKKILVGETKTVPANQQMLFSGDLMVQGSLNVLGEIKEITNNGDDGFFYTTILATENVTVRENRLLLYKDNLLVLGNLNVQGTLGAA